MRIIEVYKPRSSVEAHCLLQLLDEAGIECQIAGEELSSMYGMAVGFNMPSIYVLEEDAERACQLIVDKLGIPLVAEPPQLEFRFGMRGLLINFTLVAFILGLYVPLGAYWEDFAFSAFMSLVIGNLMVFAHGRNKRWSKVEE